MIIETSGYNNILDIYIAYGIVESLVRAGAEELTLIPLGNKYIIETENFDGSFEKGIVDAIEDMLSLHKAFGRHSPKEGGKIISDVDFSAGANINNVYWDGVPRTLERIKNNFEKPNNSLLQKRNNTVPITLMPTAGKYIPKIFGVEKRNPIKIDDLNYALSWIGFHYYTPYISVSTKDATYVHIYAIKPIETINLVEVLALKDLKKKISNYYIGGDGKFFAHKKTALLYHIAHTESIGALETILKKRFMVVAYTLERIGNNQAVRAFGEYDISKLMDFLCYLKKENPYHAIRFVDTILYSELEISVAFIDSVLYDDVNLMYNSIRGLKRKINSYIIKAIQKWFNIFSFLNNKTYSSGLTSENNLYIVP